MTIKEFIQENRRELIAAILLLCPNCEVGDDEIEEWVSNDEGLYYWAINSGVTDI